MRTLRTATLLLLLACETDPVTPAPEQVPPNVAYVVTAPIRAGTVLSEQNVKPEQLDVLVVTHPMEGEVWGRTAAEALYVGEPVREERLHPATSAGARGLASLLPSGMRLEVLSVPPASTLALEPDCWVQLIHLEGEGARAELEFHQVLAVDRAGSIVVRRSPGAIADSVDAQTIPLLRNPVDATSSDQHGEAHQEASGGTGSAVAVRALVAGVAITAGDLAPVGRLVEGAPDVEMLIGTLPRAPILAGELVRSVRLVDPEDQRGLHASIPRGMVSLGVPAPPGDAIRAGRYVDVFGSKVLQSVFVVSRDDRQLALLLTPRQAMDVATWPETWSGGLRYGLRNDLDLEMVDFED